MAHNHELNFNFYVKCAAPLILNMKNTKDRVLAAAWVKFINEDKDTPLQAKLSCLKLLLLVLQKGRLLPPFTNHPNNIEAYPQLPPLQNIVDSPKIEPQPYQLDFSGDLKTYVAYQEIGDMGSHCYFAISKDPIPTWHRYDYALFPIDVQTGNMGLYNKFAQETEEIPMEVSTDPVQNEEKEEETKEEKEEGEEGEKGEDSSQKDKEIEEKKAKLARELNKKARLERASKVAKMLGKLKKRQEEEDEWKPPNWGSNLLHFKPDVCKCELFRKKDQE